MERLMLAAGLAAWAAQAGAQAAAPIGTWQGETSGDILFVQGDGSCSSQGSFNAAGTCSWDFATATGGVLTMTHTMLPQPANIYWNVTWLDPSVILLNGVERFLRIR